MEKDREPRSGLAIRTIRMVSGMLLLLFVTTHLLNLSLGVVSLAAMDAVRPYLSVLWGPPVMGPLLLAALVSHYFLGLWAIYRRPVLNTGVQDLVQLFSGVIVVPLLATHVVGVASLKINEIPFDYAAAIRFFWVHQPAIGLQQVVLLSVVWIHGCAGLFTWMRAKENLRGMLGWIYPVAVAVPVLALLGFAEAGRGVLSGATAATAGLAPPPPPTHGTPPVLSREAVYSITTAIIWGSIALALLTFAARALRIRLQPWQTVRLHRSGAPVIATRSTLSILDSFRQHDQPHASLCEGRGRCGTCAVRVVMAEFPLPEPTALEQKTLRRIEAPADARLACQVMPQGGYLEVAPLYPAEYSFHDEDYADDAPPTDQTGATA